MNNLPENKNFEGYNSQKDKSDYTTYVVIALVVFFVLQTIIPTILNIALRLELSRSTGMKFLYSNRGVYFENYIYYPVMDISTDKTMLMRLDPSGSGKPETVAEIKVKNPRLLAGKDCIWIIYPKIVKMFKDGVIFSVTTENELNSIDTAFMQDGYPSVLVMEGNKFVTKRYKGGKWNKIDSFTAVSSDGKAGLSSDAHTLVYSGFLPRDKVQAVSHNGKTYYFKITGNFLYYLERDSDSKDDKETWKLIREMKGAGFTAILIDGEPGFVTYLSGNPLKEMNLNFYRMEKGSWKQFSQGHIKSNTGIGIYPLQKDNIAVLTQTLNLQTCLYTVTDGKIKQQLLYGVNFFKYLILLIVLSNIFFMILPFALAFFIDNTGRKYRKTLIESPEGTYEYAPIWKRGAAKVIDKLIINIPLIPIYYYFLNTFKNIDFTNPAFPVKIMTKALWLMGSVSFWSILVIVVLVWLEGKTGQTPGKKIMGIKVLNTDNMQPCGFMMSAVRNFIFIVDAFYSYLVGIGTISFTVKHQRLGDMAAKTVVIDSSTSEQ